VLLYTAGFIEKPIANSEFVTLKLKVYRLKIKINIKLILGDGVSYYFYNIVYVRNKPSMKTMICFNATEFKQFSGQPLGREIFPVYQHSF